MHPFRHLPCSAALVASLLLPSCASRGTSPAAAPSNGLNNGLDALEAGRPADGAEAPTTDLAAELAAMSSDQPPVPSGGSLDDLVARQLAKQEQLRTLRDAPRSSRSPLAAAASARSDDATFTIEGAPRTMPLGSPRSSPDPETLARDSSRAWDQAAAATPPVIEPPAPPAAPPAAPAPAPEPIAAPVAASGDPVAELAARMASMLREPGTPDRPRIADAAAMATIESLRAGALTDLDNASSSLASSLSSQDRATLLEARDRLASRPAQAGEELGKLLNAVSPAPTLTIARASLCTRVTGFGAFTPYASTVFRAGQPIRAIVYIELDHFATRPARDGDQVFADAPIDQQVSVELSQSVSLFQDPGGLLAWHVPAQPITDTSRSKRRDFYLIQRLELPRTLSIGKYNIKVQVKDLVANAEAEAVIPITVVAQ